jgi:thiol-disulfide isomerase/thioredoxin
MQDFNSNRVYYLEQTDFSPNGALLARGLNRETGIPYFAGLTIVMFQGNYCGYCTQMKPIFQQVANQLSGHYDFATVQIDSKQPSEQIFQNPQMIEKIIGQSLPGVPFIVKFLNGRRVGKEFSGNRTEKDLFDWITRDGRT